MYTYNLGRYFEQVVEAYGHNIALKFSESESVSYEELNQRANQLGRHLQGIGIQAKDVVGISGDKQLDTYALMLACLKIGAIYTMLDPDSPVDRICKIFSTCQPAVLFVGHELARKLSGRCKAAILINDASSTETEIAHHQKHNIETRDEVTGTSAAYIMYTSGSTGVPKGAVMTHGNLLNLIAWSKTCFNIAPSDVFTNANPLYFDNSVFDFYSSLFSGACLVPLSKEVVSNAKRLVETVDQFKCTSWFSVPSLLIFLQTMKAANGDNMRCLRRIIFGGEGYPKSKLKKLYNAYSDRTAFFNVYGPTECTCICSSYQITEDDFEELQGFAPLGQMAPNFSYLIVDENNQKVPDNEIGELCLMGPNVGKGYYNDGNRTQAAFIQNPYNDRYAEIMYKTGDLVKYNSDDGKIYILGRADNQIKHMGYRIELEEIETGLCRLDYISEAIVLHGSSNGFSQIVAVVSTENGKVATDIRNDLKQIIPDYMIPRTFHMLSALPKNSNGKIDRVKIAEMYSKRNSNTF